MEDIRDYEDYLRGEMEDDWDIVDNNVNAENTPQVGPTRAEFEALERKYEELERAFQILSKTLEGIQHLFIRAGEYTGKPRGRLPR